MAGPRVAAPIAPVLLLGLLAAARAEGPGARPTAYPWATPYTWDVRLVAEDWPGTPCVMRGRIIGLASLPAAGVKLYVYHADSDGRYALHNEDLNRIAAVLRTDSLGRYRVRTILPGQYEGPGHVHVEV